VLNNIPLFDGLPDPVLDEIARHAVTRTYPRNTIVISEGDQSDSLYIIESGRVKVFASDEKGKEVILCTQGPGEYFGEMALIDEAPRSASVMTLEPTKLSLISRTAFRECLADNPDVAYTLIQELTRRIRTLTDKVKSLALMDVYGRVAGILLKQAKEQDGQLVADRLTHQEIANMVGASREMVSRILKDLATGGYIEVQGKQFVIREKLPSGW
jgi:CRP/FNR family cyclic AMP-dependent transcriptional regulator